jgi:hypothetical protein
MSEPEPDLDDNAGEVEPTDNSTGAPIDIDRVQDLEPAPGDEPGR